MIDKIMELIEDHFDFIDMEEVEKFREALVLIVGEGI